MESKTKTRIALASVTALFLILIGYLRFIDQVWTIEALVIGSFAFFGTFTVSSYTAFFWALLVFGIFVLPFILNELGFLDDYPDESSDAFDEEGQTIEVAEKQVDRFPSFLKNHFSLVKITKSYMLPIGIILSIIGGCLVILPTFLLEDSEWVKRVFETGELIGQEYWHAAKYYGFIRGQLLILGVLFFVVGIVLVYHNLKSRKNQ